jgi:hypothetical protein
MQVIYYKMGNISHIELVLLFFIKFNKSLIALYKITFFSLGAPCDLEKYIQGTLISLPYVADFTEVQNVKIY